MAVTILNGFTPLASSKTGKMPKEIKPCTLNLIFHQIHMNLLTKFIQNFLALLSPDLPAALGSLVDLRDIVLLVHILTSLPLYLLFVGGGVPLILYLIKCWSSLEPCLGLCSSQCSLPGLPHFHHSLQGHPHEDVSISGPNFSTELQTCLAGEEDEGGLPHSNRLLKLNRSKVDLLNFSPKPFISSNYCCFINSPLSLTTIPFPSIATITILIRM